MCATSRVSTLSMVVGSRVACQFAQILSLLLLSLRSDKGSSGFLCFEEVQKLRRSKDNNSEKSDSGLLRFTTFQFPMCSVLFQVLAVGTNLLQTIKASLLKLQGLVRFKEKPQLKETLGIENSKLSFISRNPKQVLQCLNIELH